MGHQTIISLNNFNYANTEIYVFNNRYKIINGMYNTVLTKKMNSKGKNRFIHYNNNC